MSNFKPRDLVVWRTSYGLTKGEVVTKVTRNTRYDDLDIEATEQSPRYVVRSSGSGQLDVCPPDGLEKL